MPSDSTGDTSPHLIPALGDPLLEETTEAPAPPDLSFLLPPREPGELGWLARTACSDSSGPAAWAWSSRPRTPPCCARSR